MRNARAVEDSSASMWGGVDAELQSCRSPTLVRVECGSPMAELELDGYVAISDY